MASVEQDFQTSKSAPEIDLTEENSEEKMAEDKSDFVDDPEEFALISWNIDGLDEKNRPLRTEAVCQMMKTMNVDVFFLQEVVPETEKIINRMMSGYKLVTANNENGDCRYYTLTGLRKKTVKFLSNRVIDFDETRMDRNLNESLVKIGSSKIRLMTTHLESCHQNSAIRIKQFKESLDLIHHSPKDECVIFGGDLNIRNTECNKITFPPRIEDVWETLGSRYECRFTWDMLRNDNHNSFMGIERRRQIRFRFDRLYLRDSEPSKLRPEYFGLIGLERLRPHQCFPSDHWGILSAFRLVKKK